LQAAGYEVRTTDRVAAHRGDDWEHLPGDLRDLDFIRRAVQGMDAVAHLGAIASDRRGAAEDVMAVTCKDKKRDFGGHKEAPHSTSAAAWRKRETALASKVASTIILTSSAQDKKNNKKKKKK
jgi:uncharacterized protein YbjT (DUF2867 family)